MTRLENLSEFNFSDTRLCVPDDQGFVSWLQSVGNVTGSGLDCGTVSADRDALVALYNATDGPNWTNSAGWTTGAPVGEWYGVTTDTAGRVVGLDLQDNSLSGPLPAALGSLDKLEELILEDHGISGLIPPELGKLGNLTVLSLGSDSLTGTIPRELGDLTSLKSLGIGGSPLTGSIPPELGNLANLETLVLAGTDISDSIPPELGSLVNLTALLLQENALSGPIPSEIGNLARLEDLSLAGNSLTGPVPSELGNLSQLEALLLNDNLLTGALPASLLSLDQLQVIDIARNSGLCFPDTQPFHTWLRGKEGDGQFCHSEDRAALVSLYEATDGTNWKRNENWLSDLPLHDWYGVGTDSLGRVAGIDLSSNNLVGSIPSEFGDLSRLGYLDLSNNQLTGPVPPEFGNLSELEWLILHGNQLIGQIPDSFLQLGRLQAFTADVHNCVPSTTAFTAWLKRIPDRSATLCTDADRAALEKLYHATDGPNWTNSDNWLTGAPLEQWHGVKVDVEGRVVALELRGNGLVGTMPPELGTLAKLRSLDLSYSRFDHRSGIPPELGNLAELRTLDLGATNLAGEIPPELGNLTMLRVLLLNATHIEGEIPPELGNLTELRRLVLNSYDLRGRIPPELGNLTELQSLDVSYTKVEGGIPPELAALTKLVVLRLPGNLLTGPLPRGLLGLANLRHVDFEGNDGLCAPGTLEFARWLDAIDGTGPFCNEADISVLESLYQATGGGNWTDTGGWLDGPVLDSWHGVAGDSLGRVTELDLGGNSLSGRLPATLANLDRMTALRIGGNALSGPLPAGLARLPLTELHYADSELCVPTSPGFRAWLTALPSHEGTGVECVLTDRQILTALYEFMDGENWKRSDNWLQDSAPLGDWHGIEVDDLGRVVSVGLRFNDLAGRIPSELAGLTELRRLDLAFNWDITGEIPPELGSLAKLEGLNLVAGRLRGEIPPELGNLANLEYLFLHWNELQGEIPPELGDLTNLERLELPGNKLTGKIPPELGNLTKLRWLLLNDNDLIGEIPSGFGSLRALSYLELAHNRLEGPLPSGLFSLPRLQRVVLTGNRLSGPLPAELGRMSELNLGDNRFSGQVPPEFGDLPRLYRLHLYGNPDLSGPLPNNLASSGITELLAHGTGLCAPDRPEFRNWLASMETRRIRVCNWADAQAYLTQAVQSREYPVPLIAGKRALLRVFVVSERQNRPDDPAGAGHILPERS